MEITKDDLSNLPSSARVLIRGLVAKFEKYPSEYLSRRIEALTGWSSDFTDLDNGN